MAEGEKEFQKFHSQFKLPLESNACVFKLPACWHLFCFMKALIPSTSCQHGLKASQLSSSSCKLLWWFCPAAAQRFSPKSVHSGLMQCQARGGLDGYQKIALSSSPRREQKRTLSVFTWFPHGLTALDEVSPTCAGDAGHCQHPSWLATTTALAALPHGMPEASQPHAVPSQSNNTSNQHGDLPKEGQRRDGETQRWLGRGCCAPSSNEVLGLERGEAGR